MHVLLMSHCINIQNNMKIGTGSDIRYHQIQSHFVGKKIEEKYGWDPPRSDWKLEAVLALSSLLIHVVFICQWFIHNDSYKDKC